jgi:hypothetical protein
MKMKYNPELIFTTLPELYEKFQQQVEYYKDQKENYENLEDNPVVMWVALLITLTLLILWVYAFWMVISGVSLLRRKGMEIPYLFVIFVLFLLFYMPLFGMIIVYLLVFPEIRSLKGL